MLLTAPGQAHTVSGEAKKSFQLPALDPAVEIICRNWRSATPSTPSTSIPGPDTALEARRNRRINKVRD